MMRVGAIAVGLFTAAFLIGATQAQEAPSEPPFRAVLCNMNCLDAGNIVPAPPITDPAQDGGKHRLVVLTDMGADNDDSQSLVRLLLYSNEIDIEGLVATTSTFMMDRTNPWLIEDALKAYSQVRPNLVRHDPHYPTAEYLSSITKGGVPKFGLGGVGPGKDSEGSALLIAALKKNDSRPLWVSIWGGANTLAQALWRLRSTENAEALKSLVSKLRVYAIGDQDDSGFWIRREFPTLFWITPTGFNTGINSVDPSSNPEMISPGWLAKNIQQGHGPLGVVYPDIAYGMEGDTPAFLSLIPNGLNDPSHPNYGGWGGRFALYRPPVLPFNKTRPDGVPSQSVVVPVPDTRPIWTASEDQYTGPMARVSRRAAGPAAEADQKLLPKSAGVTLWRWREDFQNDFAARMEWTTKPYSETNHPPSVVLAKNTPAEFTVHSGREFHLNASGSYDPDNDSISYYWFEYVEGGDLAEPINITQFSQVLADFPVRAPKVDSPKTVHFICRVVDRGTPPLARYRRVIVHIVP
ncbi:MAG: DUF1593 domain-containing protein [Bryobacteraceae bacterium]